METAVIMSGVRTAIGDFGGGLSSIAPTALGAAVAKEALQRAGTAPEAVEHVVFGSVIHTEPKDMYMARVAAVEAGIPVETPALTLNRLCGSGLQAIITAAQAIQLGDATVAVAGGAESMSRAPHATQQLRTGAKMGDVQVHDMMLGALHDPFGHGHMGVTAENVAKRHQITRDEQDAFAVESHARAANAQAHGWFTDQILPVEVKGRKGTAVVATDEHVRAGATMDDMAKLRPVFDREGSVTAGNASGINDGAAAVVLMSERAAAEQGKTPMARIIGYAHAGVEPDVMGLGPIPAVTKLLKKTGLSVGDFDVIESNEAFAAQACAVARELGFPTDKTNPNGGAVALGHPVGATGAIITVKTLYELKRTGGTRGLMTMCIGGGQGIALAIEMV